MGKTRTATAELMTAEVSHLVQLVGQRYGIWFGRRILLSEANTVTATERKEIRAVDKSLEPLDKDLNDKIASYLENGTDVRDEVKDIVRKKKELIGQRDGFVATKNEKRKPFSDKLQPLGAALGYLDKVAIPTAYQRAMGKPIIPVTEAPVDLMAEMEEAKKKEEVAKKE
jgi:hypothetical protein